MVQGELFREELAVNLGSNQAKSFLSQYRLTLTLDKLLLVFIGFVIVFVLTYSFGVERGKQAAEKRFEALIPAHQETINTTGTTLPVHDPQEEVVLEVKSPLSPTVDQAGEPANTVKPETKNPAVDKFPHASPTRGKYTIQLVTYVSGNQASQEISYLQSKGYDGFVIPSGRHFQVCADYFSNQAQARTVLGRIRTTGRYPDAFVRPVVR